MKPFTVNMMYNGFVHVVLKVDPSKFTEEKANEILSFFSWSVKPDPDNSPVVEAAKKIAYECFCTATFNQLSKSGILNVFERKEGFLPLHEDHGLELVSAEAIELDETDARYIIEEGGAI